MVLFDSLIEQLEQTLGNNAKVFDFNKNINLPLGDRNKILFTKDTAYELGAGQLPCVSTLAVSSEKKYNDDILLFGKDICEIKDNCPFGKIVLLEIDDIDNDDEAFDKIKKLEHVRFNFQLDGFMSRASALNTREQIRVSKSVIKNKISFSDLGSMLIKEYLKFDFVKGVRIIFITSGNENFDKLTSLAEKIKSTTSALNHILDDINLDCASCNLKPICDEVEGMKELHMKKVNG